MTKPIKVASRDSVLRMYAHEVQAYAKAREDFSVNWRKCSGHLHLRLDWAGYRINGLAPAETLLSLARYSEDAGVQEALHTTEVTMFAPTQAFLRVLARLPESERRVMGFPEHTALVAHFDHHTDRPVTPEKLGRVLRWTNALRDAMRAARRMV